MSRLLAPTALALFGAVLALAVTGHGGAGVTPDSVGYLSAAESLRDGEGYRGADGAPFVAFPPLYPTLIAAVAFGPLSSVDAARLLDALCFGATILLAGWSVGRITGSAAYAALGAIAVLLSRPVIGAALHIWSEPPFTVLVMASLGALLMHAHGPAERRGRWLAVAFVAAGLAALTRYIGVVAVAVVAVAPLLDRPRRRWTIARGVGMAALALLPLGLWLARNVAVSGAATGGRYASADGLKSNVYDAAAAVARAFVPDRVPVSLALVVLSVGGAILAATVLWAAARDHARSETVVRATAPFAGFAVAYLVYLVGVATLTALDPIDARLIAPVLPPLIVTILGLLSASPGRARLAVSVLAAVILLSATPDTVAWLQRARTNGIGGYEAARWRGSPVLESLRVRPPDGVIYSNDPFAIRYATGRDARLSPRRHPYRSPRNVVDDVPALRDTLAEGGPVYLVWFENVPRDFLLSLAELASTLELEPEIQVSDGAVYRITAMR